MEISQIEELTQTVVTASGRVDTLTAPELGTALEKIPGTATLVLDIAGVPYMSSAGLRVLLAAQKRAAKGGGSFTLKNVQPAVKEVLDITGFADILTLA